jgi:GH15 family glucan-1,4-alpha-glucosidase
MLGNGSLTVGLNEAGLVHDFYYPYVGLDNLTTARSLPHKVGVWVDGVFSWVDDAGWRPEVDFQDDALISRVVLEHDELQLKLELHDFVDYEYNAFGRCVTVHNLADHEREIRVFFHQVFQISRSGRGDTALYVPDENYVLDYKGRCCLLSYAQIAHGAGMDQFSVGNYGIEGKEGTWRDAEDGELSGNAVEHGGVDSVLRCTAHVPAGASDKLEYWIIAADVQYSAEKIHREFRQAGLQQRLEQTRQHWQQWLETARPRLEHLNSKYQIAVRKSLMVIKVHTDKRGGIIASCDSSIYNYGRDYYSYVWPRDGAYAIWPLIRLGYTDEPLKFFNFCRDTAHPDGYLMHKYQPDRAIGSTWHPILHGRHSELPIQEDETAVVVIMMFEYFEETNDRDFAEGMYATFIQKAANFMAHYRDKETSLPHASYDLWEQKFLTHTYTVATVHRALLAAADFADVLEHPDDAVRWRDAAHEIETNSRLLFDEPQGVFSKGYLLQPDGTRQYDGTLDVSSGYGPLMFASQAFGGAAIRSTFQAIETQLAGSCPAGGVPRYLHDDYFLEDTTYPGNPWFVTTLWLAQYYYQTKQQDKARELVEWVLDHALPSGVLSEQVNPVDGSPVSVTPLVWSHAELIDTILDLSQA